MNAFLQERRPCRDKPRRPPPIAPRAGLPQNAGPCPCRSDALVAISLADHPQRPGGGAPTKGRYSPRAGLLQMAASTPPVGATPSSRKATQTTPHRPEGGAPTKGRHFPMAGLLQMTASIPPVGATPSSRKASQTTPHRPEGGAPTKCRHSPMAGLPQNAGTPRWWGSYKWQQAPPL
jgi:hypothetical protein